MLSPKATKYNKYHYGHMKGKAIKGNKIVYGHLALQSLEPSWISSRQIETIRRVIIRHTKRGVNLWIRIFPDKTVTSRASESRMGSGKGSVSHWVAVLKPGTIIIELKINFTPLKIAMEALKLANYKLPFKTKIITL
uniref:Ribosomal protein L16 n=1 Tax=Nitzschia sp. NIES-3576 TaxID=2083273 RepID=A0A2Z5ZB11_9STRA|nr:ribosomal protein L16 [Nitzschia sp. NIES-3576]